MWTIPKTKEAQDIYPCAVDTMELESDLSEQASELASRFMWRSKPSQAGTWLRRLKRERWVQEFTTRILKPSHSENFEDALTSYLEDFPANHFLKQVRDVATKIPDICSPTSSEESKNVGQLSLFSKTSKESLVPSSKEITGTTQPEPRFCSMSLESWSAWVTEQRQSRRARQKSALLTELASVAAG